jgi:hypothetical protein
LMSKPTGASPSPSLVGAWHLKSVGGKDPTTISIKSWQIEFREQGNWVYSGAMTGEYEGTKLSGSGTWLLKGSELDYTAGSNKGRRSLTRSGDSLKWKRTGRDSIRKAGVALAEACAVCSPKSGSVSAMGMLRQLRACNRHRRAAFISPAIQWRSMNGHRWGAAGPPLEAYSRVTNPERFASLHAAAEGLLDRLEWEFETDRREAHGLDPELEEGCNLPRPSVAIVPRDRRAASLIIVFSAFPGLRVRFGRWYVVAFPTCGCDACDETPESEIERLRSLIDHMTAGRFREAIRVSADGSAWKESEFGSIGTRCSEKLRLDQARVQKLLDAEDRSSYQWGPWPRRK